MSSNKTWTRINLARWYDFREYCVSRFCSKAQRRQPDIAHIKEEINIDSYINSVKYDITMFLCISWGREGLVSSVSSTKMPGLVFVQERFSLAQNLVKRHWGFPRTTYDISFPAYFPKKWMPGKFTLFCKNARIGFRPGEKIQPLKTPLGSTQLPVLWVSRTLSLGTK